MLSISCRALGCLRLKVLGCRAGPVRLLSGNAESADIPPQVLRDLGCLRHSDQRTLLHAAVGRKDNFSFGSSCVVFDVRFCVFVCLFSLSLSLSLSPPAALYQDNPCMGPAHDGDPIVTLSDDPCDPSWPRDFFFI